MATRKLSRRKSARKTQDRGKKPQQPKGARAARALEQEVEKEQRGLVKETEGGLRAGGFRVARGGKKRRR